MAELDPRREALIRELTAAMADGRLPSPLVMNALREIGAGSNEEFSSADLLDSLNDEKGAESKKLAEWIREFRLKQASLHKAARRAGKTPPLTPLLSADLTGETLLEWEDGDRELTIIESTILDLKDWFFLQTFGDAVPDISGKVLARWHEFVRASSREPAIWSEVNIALAARRCAELLRSEDEELAAALEKFAAENEKAGAEKTFPNDARSSLDKLGMSGQIITTDVAEIESLVAEFRRASTMRDKRRIASRLCRRPSDRAAGALLKLAEDPPIREEILVELTLRFGDAHFRSWEQCSKWLAGMCEKHLQTVERLETLLASSLPELLFASLSTDSNNATLADRLATWCGRNASAVTPADFISRWSKQLLDAECRVITGAPRKALAEPAAPSSTEAAGEEQAVQAPLEKYQEAQPEEGRETQYSRSVPLPRHVAPIAPKPIASSAPSVVANFWENHLQPFFLANWYLVAGVFMVIVGSSLLAYYTWDKHWMIRYTIMPLMLGGFTIALAQAGAWIEKKDGSLKGMAATVRGAALCLLPVNYMILPLIADDPTVTHPLAAVTVMTALYVAIYGFFLSRWCGAVHDSLASLLARPLLLFNLLVLLVPISRTWSAAYLDPVIAGFYIGFAALAFATIRFNRRVLTKELAAEERVPWFFGITLSLTFLQIFAWVHGSLGIVPTSAAYAPMVILGGWLLLLVERRTLELDHTSILHRSESFLGFAMVFLGIIMSAGHPHLRIACFLLAGGVWLFQALSREHPLHYWISLLLLLMGGASVGLLREFPGPWLGALGVALSMWMAGISSVGRKNGAEKLGDVATDLKMTTLIFSTAVALLAQWHYGSEPIATAGILCVIAALILRHALKHRLSRWLVIAMVELALALPYLGCVDMTGYTLHGNNMVFGLGALSALWLIAVGRAENPFVTRARSTVLWIYGAFALAAMALRVVIERHPSESATVARIVMDFTGPFLMAACLAFASYYSRSLAPGIFAGLLLAVLFPVMRADVEKVFHVSWGSGLGSASSALAIVVASFGLRSWKRLEHLGDGDRLFGDHPFPFRRHDHSLFTLPLLISAVFLAIKVMAWNVPNNFETVGLSTKTGYAMLVLAGFWMLIAIYNGQRRRASIGTHLGWICLFVGITMLYSSKVYNRFWHWQDPVLIFFIALQLIYWTHRYLLEQHWPFIRDSSTAPILMVLRVGSMLLGVIVILRLGGRHESNEYAMIAAFTLAQLLWHSIREKLYVHGALFTLLTFVILLSGTAPELHGRLLRRISLEHSLMPALWWIFGVELLHVALEARDAIRDRLRAVLTPLHAMSLIVAVIVSMITASDVVMNCSVYLHALLVNLLVLILIARSRASGPIALLAAFFAYLAIQYPELSTFASSRDRAAIIGMPLRLAEFAVGLAIAGALYERGRERWPRVMEGTYASRLFSASIASWLMTAACAIAVIAELRHFAYRGIDAIAQLPVPYLAATAFCIVALSSMRMELFVIAGIFFTLGDIQFVRVFFGESLRSGGLAELHLVCLGLALTLLVFSLAKRLPILARSAASFNRASLLIAGIILAILPANYFAAPNLDDFTQLRFAVSGVMALLAGLYFRSASRNPGEGEKNIAACESMYHLGVCVAIWCAALLVPSLRQPSTALYALGLPVLFFYARAEWGRHLPERARLSASTLCFSIVALYIFRFAFQMTLFPEIPIITRVYHQNSWIVIIVGAVMLRLRGLGGTWWLGYYAGLAIIVGSFFALTALPELSPFTDPIPAAWCAIGLAHFWTLVTSSRSPLRTALQRLGSMDDAAWHGLRRPWGYFILLASQFAAMTGIVGAGADTFAVAPLILGAASVLIHHGGIRGSSFYYVCAGIEIIVALHMDFITPSHLPARQVVWAILGLWAAGAFVEWELQVIDAAVMRRLALVFAPFVFGHICYHGASSGAGMSAMSALAMLAALTPTEERRASSLMQKLTVFFLLCVPTWLAFFSQKAFFGARSHFTTWNLLVAAATVYATGVFGQFYRERMADYYDSVARRRPRIADNLLSWLGEHGGALNAFGLMASYLLVLSIAILHYGSPFPTRELMLIVALLAVQTVSWHAEGKRRDSMYPYILLQIAVVALFAVIRRHLLLTTSFWTMEYDVWVSLAVSFALTGAKDAFDLEPRKVRTPLAATLWLMPAVAIAWTLFHHLGSNVAMIIVGMHGLMFAWLGRRDRKSPYNFVSVAGFVSFVIIAFWSKLGLRVLPAYVVPVGLGILVLLQLFRDAISPGVRNNVRLVVVLAMLGSAGFHALADDRYPIAFNMTMLLLCIAAMGLGGILKIRLYLAMGFAGVMVDLISIVYKATMRMERNSQMTAVGAMVLLGGIALVVGAVLYRTHQQEIRDKLGAWKSYFGGWE